MALRTLTARARSSLLHEASLAPRFSPPATRVSSTVASAPPIFSAPAVMSRRTTAPPASMLQKSCTYCFSAFSGGSLIYMGVGKEMLRTSRAFNGGSLAHIGLGQKMYSTKYFLKDPQDMQKLFNMQAKTLLKAKECHEDVRLVYNLQVFTVFVIAVVVVGAVHVGNQMIERAKEVLGQLGQHYPEIIQSILGELIFQLKIPFLGNGQRFVLKEYWFNKPSVSVKRCAKKLRLQRGRKLWEEERLRQFHVAEEERRQNAQSYIVGSEARKKLYDEKIKERLEEERRKARGE